MKPLETEDPLVVFLYCLMRDEVTFGVVESIVQEIEKEGKARTLCEGWVLTNGHAAAYAQEVRDRLHAIGQKHDIQRVMKPLDPHEGQF